MLRDEHPFTSSNPFGIRARCQVCDILIRHQIGPSSVRDLVKRNTQDGVPDYCEYHEIVVDLKVADSETSNTSDAIMTNINKNVPTFEHTSGTVHVDLQSQGSAQDADTV